MKSVDRTGRADSPKGMRLAVVLAALVAVVIVGLVAAPSDAQEIPTAAGEDKEATATASRDVAEMLEDESFHYQPAGRRDPFKSLMILQTKQKDISLLPPIQQVELDSVKIAGIIMDEVEGPRAMVKAAGGQTFVVKKGMLIGRNEGEIIEVSLKGIRVVETYVDFMGRETLKEVFIKARPDKLKR